MGGWFVCGVLALLEGWFAVLVCGAGGEVPCWLWCGGWGVGVASGPVVRCADCAAVLSRGAAARNSLRFAGGKAPFRQPRRI